MKIKPMGVYIFFVAPKDGEYIYYNIGNIFDLLRVILCRLFIKWALILHPKNSTYTIETKADAGR